ncbi:hypothetical protein LPJ57_011169, partial [Coemansia sp. RSA 486]
MLTIIAISWLLPAFNLVFAESIVGNSLFNRGDSCPLGITSCSTSAANVDTCCVPKYGLLVLVQQWHVDLGPSDEFTLHGLWPDTCTGKQTGGNGCDNSRVYSNVSDIIQTTTKETTDKSTSLFDNLNTFWPSYTGDNNVFWSHEWSKHGTCVTTLFPRCYGPSYTRYRDVVDYFNAVLDLRKKYNIYSALSKAGIEPSTDAEYTMVEFKEAINSALGIDVVLKCKDGVLSEIWS